MRNADEIKNMDGMQYITSVPKNEIITCMTVAGGKLFVSTDKHIYTLEDGKRLEVFKDTQGYIE